MSIICHYRCYSFKLLALMWWRVRDCGSSFVYSIITNWSLLWCSVAWSTIQKLVEIICARAAALSSSFLHCQTQNHILVGIGTPRTKSGSPFRRSIDIPVRDLSVIYYGHICDTVTSTTLESRQLCLLYTATHSSNVYYVRAASAADLDLKVQESMTKERKTKKNYKRNFKNLRKYCCAPKVPIVHFLDDAVKAIIHDIKLRFHFIMKSQWNTSKPNSNVKM